VPVGTAGLQVEDGHGGAPLGESARDGSPDSGCTARHDGNEGVEFSHGPVLYDAGSRDIPSV